MNNTSSEYLVKATLFYSEVLFWASVYFESLSRALVKWERIFDGEEYQSAI